MAALCFLPSSASANHPGDDWGGFAVDRQQVCVWSFNDEHPMHIAIRSQASGEIVAETTVMVPGNYNSDGYAEHICWSYEFGPGTWNVEVSQEASTNDWYPAYFATHEFRVPISSTFAFGKPFTRERRVFTSIHAQGAIIGREVKVSVERFYWACSLAPFQGQAVKFCSFIPKATRYVRREMTMRPDQTMRVGRRERGKYLRFVVRVQAPAFTEDGMAYKQTSESQVITVGRKNKRKIERRYDY